MNPTMIASKPAWPVLPAVSEFGKVAVLLGGRSVEREVSLMSGGGVLQALRASGVDAHGFDPAEKPLSDLKAEGFDRCFVALHGPFGEDGTLQGALEYLGIPYTGSGVMASALAMDKWRTKLIWQGLGLPTARFELLDAQSDWTAVVARLGLPMFVKPSLEGSSLGMTKVKSVDDLPKAYALAARYAGVVIAEAFIDGPEYTAGLLGDSVLPFIRIEPATEYYDYEAKYSRNDTRYHVPCGLGEAKERELTELAHRAMRALGCVGWGRCDLMVDSQGRAFLLEVNTAPGMTSHSLVPIGARAIGIDYAELCLRVLAMTLPQAKEVPHVA
jgi:D-alanine-D-alanine ligase